MGYFIAVKQPFEKVNLFYYKQDWLPTRQQHDNKKLAQMNGIEVIFISCRQNFSGILFTK